jgi:ubiquinone/menaquinone biosynthesis C-methylase UbiE
VRWPLDCSMTFPGCTLSPRITTGTWSRSPVRALEPFGQRATVTRADAAALPFPDDRFDVVLSFAMFHHVPDWERAVGEAMRVLRLGGTLVGYDLSRIRQLENQLRRLGAHDVRTRRFLGGLLLRFLVIK